MYAIQRGRVDKVIAMAKEEGITADEGLRPVSTNSIVFIAIGRQVIV